MPRDGLWTKATQEEGLGANRASQSKQPQIKHQNRPHQDNEPQDVQDLDRGIERG